MVTTIDLQLTNNIWNSLGLNSRWNIGEISSLIKGKIFKTKQDWEDYYYSSGKDRLDRMKYYSTKAINEANSVIANYKDSEMVDINSKYGRTKEDLYNKALFFQHFTAKDSNLSHLSVEDCFELIKKRVIDETWDGIVLRERNTIDKLSKLLPKFTFLETDSDKDCDYGVDYEIYYNKNLILGLQIKPESYKNGKDKDYLKKAWQINETKHSKYRKDFNRDIIYIFSDLDGTILDKTNINQLKEYHDKL